MNRIIIKLTIVATILTSCSNEPKQNKIDMKVTAMENQDGTSHLTYHSKSKSTSELVADLETVLEKLNSKEIINSNQVLFYIDGTNGNIFISGYDIQ